VTRARIRQLAVVSVIVGVAVGGATPAPPRPAPMVRDGYTVLAGDFHVHGFPDGLPPWDTVREARQRRLDVIALTGHNSLNLWRLWKQAPWMPAGSGDLIVLPGEELTAVGYHMAIVGLTREIPWHQPLVAAAAAAHAQHAVAILAHPSGDAFHRTIHEQDLRFVDGVEVAHPAMELSEDARRDLLRVYERGAELNPAMAAIGSSDFHYIASIGLCRTYLFVREATAEGVLDALRAGRTAACDARGRTYGPAALAASVAERCRLDALGPTAADAWTARAGRWLAWFGLLALIVA
jgi:PHP-associated